MNKQAFYNLSYGVYLCTSWNEGEPVGCTANSAMQITSSPATIAVSLNHENFTAESVKKSGYFSVCVLPEDCEPLLIGTFGFRSSRNFKKFEKFPYEVKGKLPVPNAAMAYFCCKVIDTMETSTHTVFLGEVFECDVVKEGTPMTYSYYHKVVKGKTAKNAPTYVAE